jgi:hypothetical protein
MTDKLSEYGHGFQVKVLAAMFTDRIFLQQISDIIQPDYSVVKTEIRKYIDNGKEGELSQEGKLCLEIIEILIKYEFK